MPLIISAHNKCARCPLEGSYLLSLFISFILVLSALTRIGSADPGINPASPILIKNSGYERLRMALAHYREIAGNGGWPSVSKGRSLKRSMQEARVVELRKRLLVTGDLPAGDSTASDLFDEGLHEAVVRFQKRHGLTTDGAVGPETLKMLNVTVEERIRQIEVNLERLRLTAKASGPRYITVNTAAFELEVFEEGDAVMSMKVIVGKPYMNTPVFTEKMTHIVLNPSWYVPDSIAIKEILPKIKKDPAYLSNEGLKVYIKGKGYRQEADISAAALAGLSGENFQYRFVQVPGIKNPLGKIKFVFPNKYNVYLHDTPSKLLFERSNRAFSHGCIRIEKPLELAEYLLRGNPSWNREHLLAAIETGKELKVRIPSPVNVHIQYLTSWVDSDNIIQFRKDIYMRDEQLKRALMKKTKPFTS